MDNRITKKRLSNLLAYEWIIITIVCIASLVVWEFIYNISAVRLSVGQDYRIFYDYYFKNDKNVVNALLSELGVQEDLGYSNGKTFSYDILEIDSEFFESDYDVISYRLSSQEGDILITDDKERSKYSSDLVEYTQSIAKTRVDNYDEFMILDKLLADAKAYLQGLLRAGETQIKAENLDPIKIEKVFMDRLSGDNRFRSNEQKAIGVKLETERLNKLCEEVADFEKIMALSNEYFFTYTRNTQFRKIAEANGYSPDLIEKHEKNIQKEIDEGRENARYGLRLDRVNKQKLTSTSKADASRFFSLVDYKVEDDSEKLGESKDTVLMVLDYSEYQEDLQFESIIVINNIVRACSTILD